MVDSTDDSNTDEEKKIQDQLGLDNSNQSQLIDSNSKEEHLTLGLRSGLANKRNFHTIKIGSFEKQSNSVTKQNTLTFNDQDSSTNNNAAEELRIPVSESHKDFQSLSVNSPQSTYTIDNDGPVFLDEYNKLYDLFKNLPLIIEGPELESDYSYFLIDKCEELKELEKGISLQNFEAESLERDPEMEFRILSRINCHKIHYQNLQKSQQTSFKNKNRYNEVLPFMHSMVRLKDAKDKTDRFWYYINANYVNTLINSDRGKKVFIAATAPLPSTTEHFWQMILENKVTLITMLCQEVENGKEMSYTYYDNNDNNEEELPQPRQFGDISISVISKTEKIHGLIKRKIRVVKKNDTGEEVDSLIVTHLQETKWEDNRAPDHSCEEGVFERINHLLTKIKRNREKNPEGSVLVHCSAGCGRTGTLIGLYSIIEGIQYQIGVRSSASELNNDQRETYPDAYYLDQENGQSVERISVFSSIRRIREQRWNLVKNTEQYKYIYSFTREWIRRNQAILLSPQN
eukprot:403334591